MKVEQIREISAELKASTATLKPSYKALKTLLLERTGTKDSGFLIKRSVEDARMAQELADELGISVSCLYRMLVKLTYLDRSNMLPL